MEVRVLIDSIVRQTTVLIAQLATTGGVRAPLAHIANETFLSLVTELEGQGLGRKVIADMFGMALRSYQQKVQRLSESATDRGTTLWEAIHRFLQEREVASRAEIFKRFRHDDESSVRGILNDLVESGLIYRSGRGHATIYRIISDEDMDRAGLGAQASLAEDLVWLTVYRNTPASREALIEAVSLEPARIDQALAALVLDGRVSREADEAGAVVFTSDTCMIPLGEGVGWEAGLFDHFQAVVTSACAKLQNGNTRALPSDQIGGSTFRFDVWAGHPYEDEVKGLLAHFRSELGELWDRVASYSQDHEGPADKRRVTFYFGQSVRLEGNPLEQE